MNYHMIRYVLGQIMKLEAALMGLPLLVSLYYIDEGMIPLLSVMLPLGISGYILTGFKPKNQTIYAREGFVIVAFAWILMSAIGALPFVKRAFTSTSAVTCLPLSAARSRAATMGLLLETR